MLIQCCMCGQTNFRRAHVHRFDIKHLFRLQYPVRCQVCHDRAYTSITNALTLTRNVKIRRVRGEPSAKESAGRYV